jgi:hypothetical protein
VPVRPGSCQINNSAIGQEMNLLFEGRWGAKNRSQNRVIKASVTTLRKQSKLFQKIFWRKWAKENPATRTGLAVMAE